jgi:hypothetical protein
MMDAADNAMLLRDIRGLPIDIRRALVISMEREIFGHGQGCRPWKSSTLPAITLTATAAIGYTMIKRSAMVWRAVRLVDETSGNSP